MTTVTGHIKFTTSSNINGYSQRVNTLCKKYKCRIFVNTCKDARRLWILRTYTYDLTVTGFESDIKSLYQELSKFIEDTSSISETTIYVSTAPPRPFPGYTYGSQ